MKKLALAVSFFSFAALADEAAPVIGADTGIQQIALSILDAIQHKNWGALVSLLVIAIVFGLRYFADKLPGKASEWLNHPVVAWALPSIISTAGALATSLLAGTGFSLPLLISAVSKGLMANALYVGAKKVAEAREISAAKAAAVETKADAVAVLKEEPKP